MKKVELLNDFLIMKEIEDGTIKPNGNETVETFFCEHKLELILSESVTECKSAYIVAYDKKRQKSVAYESINVISDRELIAEIGNEFVGLLENAEVEYVRLCVLLVMEHEYTFFFINKKDQDSSIKNVTDNEFVGTVTCVSPKNNKRLIVYYSAGGLLSMKFISIQEWLKKYIDNKVIDIRQKDNSLMISLECGNCDSMSWDIVFCKRIKDGEYAKVAILDKVTVEELSGKRQKIVIEITEEKLLQNKLGTFFLLSVANGYEVPIVIADEINTQLGKKYCASESELQWKMIANENRQLEIQVAKKFYSCMFSIVMAVHNTELYLEEALNSIIKQKNTLQRFLLGHKSNNYEYRVYDDIYQVILVDDGSTDRSGEICDKYAEEHDNFVVIHQQNSGVSAARNTGIEYAEGKYINFMDSDDRLSDTVFEDTFTFFEQHYNEIEALAFPSYFFDAVEGEHWLNDKFKKGNRAINLWEEYDASLVFVNSTIYKGDVIRSKKIRFDTELLTSEDIKFNYQLLMQCGPRVGVIDSCAYWYRRRSGGELSAVQTHKRKENYYTKFLSNFMEWLIEQSKIQYGCIAKFVQSVIMQQLQWRFWEDTDAKIAINVLGEDGFEIYRQHIFDVSAQMDDDIILEQKKLFVEHKAYILRNKYKSLPQKEYYGHDFLLHYGNTLITSMSKLRTQIDFLQIEKGKLKIEGSMHFLYKEDKNVRIFLKYGNEYVLCEAIKRQSPRWSLGEQILFIEGFCGEIDIADVDQAEIEIACEIDDQLVIKKNIKFGKRAPLNVTYKNSYYTAEKWAVKYAKGKFYIDNIEKKVSRGEELLYESLFIAEVEKKNGKDIKVKNALELRKRYMTWRMLNYRNHRKKIWLISDRPEQADDNGEEFFMYMLKYHEKDADCYFVINEDSKDYLRLEKTNKVVVHNSEEHRLLHLMADVIVSSQGSEYITDPFILEGVKDIFRDITYRHKYIFLQHGVIKDDLSKWLNRYVKNIDGFITSAKPEYQSILNGNYYYTNKEVWLTGLPRYDKLYHNEHNVIVVMPTWRKYILAEDKEIAGKFYPSMEFKNSLFYEFYNKLFQNNRLIEALKKYDYQMVVKMHPLLDKCTELFTFGERIKPCSDEKRYVDLFAEAQLLITDYSSTAMDFAYLDKPVIYCQFDKEEFFSGDHMYEAGYFDYERDGFGDVTYDLESCVEQIIRQLENGCVIEKKYADRIKDFFEYQDKGNCERIYKKIVEIVDGKECD